jgi:hypothetical protein
VPNIQEQWLTVLHAISKNSVSAVMAAVAKILDRLHTLEWGQQQQILKKCMSVFLYRLGPGPFGNALAHRYYPLL